MKNSTSEAISFKAIQVKADTYDKLKAIQRELGASMTDTLDLLVNSYGHTGTNDSAAVFEALAACNLTVKEAAEYIGARPLTFMKKVLNLKEFKSSELMKLAKLLGLSRDEINRILFRDSFSEVRRKKLYGVIGFRLKVAREKRGLTVEELAKATDTTVASITAYEAGFRIPRDAMKIRLAEALGTTVQDLFLGPVPSVREYLRKARGRRRPGEMAAALDISEGYYLQIEAGEAQNNMDMKLVEAISKITGLTVSQILDEERQRTSA